MKASAYSIVPPVIPLPIVLPIVGMLVPLCIPSPQIVVGVIVNALLVLYAVRLPSKSYTLMCIAPSIGAVGNGIVLGTITPYLVYFLPGIWIGNMLFVYCVRRLWYRGIFVSVGVASMLKAAILFLIAYVFVQSHVVPKIFLDAMGFTQLITAFIGGMLAIAVHKHT